MAVRPPPLRPKPVVRPPAIQPTSSYPTMSSYLTRVKVVPAGFYPLACTEEELRQHRCPEEARTETRLKR